MQTTLINPYEMKANIQFAIKIAGIIIAACIFTAALVAFLWLADEAGFMM